MIVRRWIPPLLWATFILVLTSIPGARLPRVGVEGLDKVVHFICYGVLAILALPAVSGGGRRLRGAAVVLVTIAIFAALDEWHQQFIPGRTMDLADWYADTFGALLGLTGALVLRRRRVTS